MGGLFTDGNPRMAKRLITYKYTRPITVKERVFDFANQIKRTKVC